MNETEIPKRFELVKIFPDFSPLSFKMSLTEIEKVYGIAHQDSSTERDAPGPTLYWGLEYPCELKILIEFHCMSDLANIYAEQPEIEHILSHLSLPIKEKWLLSADDKNFTHFFPPNNSMWNLWRQDDNGHKEVFISFRWEYEARCRLRQFEKLHHKQTYWLEKTEVR